MALNQGMTFCAGCAPHYVGNQSKPDVDYKLCDGCRRDRKKIAQFNQFNRGRSA